GWTGTSSRGTHMVSEEQIQALCEWLRTDYWCLRTKLYACAYCGLARLPPKGLGLCVSCYRQMKLAFRIVGRQFNRRAIVDVAIELKMATPEEDRDWIWGFDIEVATE